MTSYALAFSLLLASGAEAPVRDKGPARVYTNADLERVSPYRGETGALSEPAVEATSTPSPRSRDDSPRRARDEAYWRREAARVREKIATLREQAAEVQSRLEAKEQERRSSTRSSRASTEGTAALERRLARLSSRMRALEEDLADRARTAGALPGWLR